MSLLTPFITIHAVENATGGLNQSSKERGQTLWSNWCHLQTCAWPLFKKIDRRINDWWKEKDKDKNQPKSPHLTHWRLQQGHLPIALSPQRPSFSLIFQPAQRPRQQHIHGLLQMPEKKLRNRFKVGNFILCEKKRYFFYYHELGFNSQLRILKMIFLLDIY